MTRGTCSLVNKPNESVRPDRAREFMMNVHLTRNNQRNSFVSGREKTKNIHHLLRVTLCWTCSVSKILQALTRLKDWLASADHHDFGARACVCVLINSPGPGWWIIAWTRASAFENLVLGLHNGDRATDPWTILLVGCERINEILARFAMPLHWAPGESKGNGHQSAVSVAQINAINYITHSPNHPPHWARD